MTNRIRAFLAIPLLLIAATAWGQAPPSCPNTLTYGQCINYDNGASKADVINYVAGALAANPSSLPSQAGNSGKALVTNGTTASWQTPSANATSVNGAAAPTSASVVGTNGAGQLVAQPVTGSGNNVLATSPTLVTPNLGVPSAIDLTNATNLPSSALAPIATSSVIGNFSGSTQAPQAYTAILVTSGTNGGILAFNGTNSLTSSGALAANNLVVGGGAGGVPTTLTGTGLVSVSSGAAAVLTLNPNGTVSNTSLGTGALAAATGISNTAFGNNSFATATTANSNTGVGLSAGRYQTGGNNSALGSLALTGVSATPGTGSNNTAMGFNSLTNCQSACANNTGVGQNSGSSVLTGSNNTFIGNAVCSTGCDTVTNVMVFGTTNATIPTSTSTTNELDFGAGSTAVLRITGTGAPATSKALFFGTAQALGMGSNGTTFTLGTGTGACATTSTLTGGASSGSFLCTGTAGASTIIVNLPTAPNGNGWICGGSDITSGVAFTQVTPTATTSCKLTGTVATTSDKVGFWAFAY